MTIETDAQSRHRPNLGHAHRPEAIRRLKRIALIRKVAEARARQAAQKEGSNG